MANEYCVVWANVIEFTERVTCELSSANKLLLTEMIFNGVFNNSRTEPCFELFLEKPCACDEMSGALDQMHNLARRIVKISTECKLDLNEQAYVGKFKPFLMGVVLS